METEKHELATLKNLTLENIEKRKDYALKTPKRFEQVKDYNLQYLQKSIDVNWRKPHPLPKDSKGDEVKFNSAPIANYNTLLSMAFAKAQKLFSALRNKKEITTENIFTEEEINNAQAEGANTITPIECLRLSSQLLRGKNSSLIKSIKKGEMHQVNEMALVLEKVYKVLNELRNYHSHILHEPGPVMFKDLYGAIKPDGKIKQEEWEIARNWFKNKMEEVKQHLVKSREKELEKAILTQQQKEDYQKVLDRIKGYEFERNGYITRDALLFIACMFLRKSDAEYFIRKWTGLKKNDEIFKKTRVFFTYYSIKDKKSLHTQNTDLLKFRKIIGVLSSLPEFTNLCFAPFNKFIQLHNDYYGELAEHENSKAGKERMNAYCIPVRKKFNPTSWYLDYLHSKGLLNDFKIACYKTPEERLDFLNKNGITDGILSLKLKMKQASGDEKKRLTAIYKETKKNYTFKSGNEKDLNYCSKNENAIIQYCFTTNDEKKEEITVQAHLSCDLLMKWSFVELLWKGQGEDVKNNIKSFMVHQYTCLIRGNLNKAKVLPPSLKNAEDNPVLNYSVAKAIKLLDEKLKTLYKFQTSNENKRAPWRFGAKRKLDIIFDFVHVSYTQKALKEGKNKDVRRHDALNDLEYLDALDLLRFYGKNYSLPEFRKMFFENKKIYFEGIQDCLEQSQTLEELYTAVYNKQKKFYKDIKKKLKEKNLPDFIALFNPKIASSKSNIPCHAKRFATNQVIPHEQINIRRERAENLPEYKEWVDKVKDKDRTTDFSLMRYILSNRNKGLDTNSDYLMKIIMPVLLDAGNMKKYLENIPFYHVPDIKSKLNLSIRTESYKEMLLPKNNKDKIQGNTSLFNALMKNKTDELMLWEIAKAYWFATFNKPCEINTYHELKRGDLIKDKPYKSTFFFYKIFSNEVIVKLTEGPEIKIKPKKFDDEFQYYETENINTFIQAHQTAESTPIKGNDGYFHYEELNKQIKDTIAKYLDDMYLLLTAEKQVVKDNYDELTAILHAKSNNVKWEGYQFTFDNELLQKFYDKINSGGINYSMDDFKLYRNKVFHQQIQPDTNKYKTIKKDLFNYCVSNKLI